jgi:heterodisulfide reductase subunit A
MVSIIFTRNGNGHHTTLNYNELIQYTSKLKGVGKVWNKSDLPIYSMTAMKELLKSNKLTKIIIAGDEPGMLKSLFSKVMFMAGGNPENIFLVNFKEHGIYTNKSLGLAKKILQSIINSIPLEESLITEESIVNKNTLVIGGGIAGIQASLEIANGQQKVFLVEKSGTIGGHMAMFDKTFPTLDCAACILTPKMVEVGQHSNIELLTYSEVKSVTGNAGNFKVVIHKKARRVNLYTCIGCGTCSEKCPSKVSGIFDSGTTLQKAIYIPFPQAVPNKYMIDEDSCIYVKNGKCGVCAKVCPVPDCINLDEKDEDVEIQVGNIIVATGFKTFDAGKIDQFGYGKYPNVLTSLELERLVNAAGPTGGFIKFRSRDKKGNWIFSPESDEPKSVAIIHCVGSRDENYNKYCSKVCCMYSLKLAHLIKEKLPEADVSEYYIDMRAFGKGYEEFYERIKKENIHIIRGRTAQVKQNGQGMVIRTEDIEGYRLLEQKVDMVILSVGIEPAEGASSLAEMLGLPQDNNGWFSGKNYISEPTSTQIGGITIAGVCQGPKDIPDTVAQASAAASSVLKSILKGKIIKSQITSDQIINEYVP